MDGFLQLLRRPVVGRREILLAGLLPITGCVTTTPDTTPTQTPTAAGEVVADETLYSDTSYPVELQADDQLTITVDVHTGGPVVVVIRRDGAEENTLREQVDTEAGFGVEIETNGVYRIHVLNVNEADFRVVIRNES